MNLYLIKTNFKYAANLAFTLPAKISSIGLELLFNNNHLSAVKDAIIFGISATYSYKVVKDHHFTSNHIKVAIGMMTSLQDSYSTIKLTSNAIAIINSAWNGKLNINDNMDWYNAFKVFGFKLQNINTITSLKNSVFGITKVFGEDYIPEYISNKVPFILNGLVRNSVSNFMLTDGKDSSDSFDKLFDNADLYINQSTVFSIVSPELQETPVYDSLLQQVVHESINCINNMIDTHYDNKEWVNINSRNIPDEDGVYF